MRALIVALGIVALLAAGCGGGSSTSSTSGGRPATVARTTTASAPPLSKAAYEAQLKQIAAEIRNSIGQSSSSGKIPKGKVDQLAQAFHTFADRLGELNPPAAIKQLHARLIKALDDLGDEFPSIASKLNSKDPSSAIALLGANAIQELIKIGDELRTRGYTLNLNP